MSFNDDTAGDYVLPFVRSPYNYDRKLVSDETGVACLDPSLTQQQFRDESDINFIVDTFTRTGVLPSAPVSPQFGDFTGVHDFHSASNFIAEARSKFMELPAKVRSRFANDPGRLIEFLSDDKNREEAVNLGLLASLPVETRANTNSAVEAPKGKVSKKPSVSSSNDDTGGNEGD